MGSFNIVLFLDFLEISKHVAGGRCTAQRSNTCVSSEGRPGGRAHLPDSAVGDLNPLKFQILLTAQAVVDLVNVRV